MGKEAKDVSVFIVTLLLLILPKEDAVAESSSSLDDINVSEILDSIQKGYDKRIRPNYGGPPVDVGVTMYVLSISSVSEVQMDFTMDFYFRQYWQDNRLQFTARPGIESLSVGAEMIDKIWVPDTFFANEKSAYFHKATTMNSFLRFSATGDVLRSLRLTVTAACPMNLQYFPMDRQLCTIEIESFGYTMSDIRYNWHKGAGSVGISPDVQLPQFRVIGHRQKAKEILLSTGNYSRLVCEIQFVRSMGYYLIQIYIPSSLIVIISWVSFWLNRNATPARVALGVTTVLTMTTLMSSTNAALPKISYVKSIDVYLGTCFVMVFASLLEYATVGYMGKRIQMRKSRLQALQKLAEQRKTGTSETNHAEGGAEGAQPKQTNMESEHMTRRKDWLCLMKYCKIQLHSFEPPAVNKEVRFKVTDPKAHGKGVENTINPPTSGGGGGDAEAGERAGAGAGAGTGGGGDPNTFQGKNLNKLCGISPSDIDKYSRVVFPVCFVCFNLMYWIIYLHISDEIVEDIVPLSAE